MDKDFIEKQYKLAYLCYKTAKSEDEQWEERRNMARLEAIAMQEFGFEYADTLKSLLD